MWQQISEPEDLAPGRFHRAVWGAEAGNSSALNPRGQDEVKATDLQRGRGRERVPQPVFSERAPRKRPFLSQRLEVVRLTPRRALGPAARWDEATLIHATDSRSARGCVATQTDPRSAFSLQEVRGPPRGHQTRLLTTRHPSGFPATPGSPQTPCATLSGREGRAPASRGRAGLAVPERVSGRRAGPRGVWEGELAALPKDLNPHSARENQESKEKTAG